MSSHRVNCALHMKFGKLNLENRYDINTELKYINLSIYHNTEKIRNNNGGVHSIICFIDSFINNWVLFLSLAYKMMTNLDKEQPKYITGKV